MLQDAKGRNFFQHTESFSPVPTQPCKSPDKFGVNTSCTSKNEELLTEHTGLQQDPLYVGTDNSLVVLGG